MLKTVDSNLDTLAQAIKSKDEAKFETAYRELTAACNACHVRAGEPQIRIMVPLSESGSMFPDQDFANGDGRK
jgi:cytochrome c553